METKMRLNYLDWLRVLLILTVFFFHSIRFFDLDGWQIKNATTYLGPQIMVYFVSSWMMPLIFIVSGASIYYALGKRGAGQFIKDRALRLLVPLAVGLFTHVALQVYLERVSHGQYVGSFWQWYPGYISSIGSGGFNWTGMHLWYLEMLFLFSLVCLPLFLWLRRGSGTRLLAWLDDRLATSGLVLLPMVLLILPTVLMDPDSGILADYNSFGGWNLPSYLIFFLAGFLIPSSKHLQSSVIRLRWFSLAGGLVTTIADFGLFAAVGDVNYGTPEYTLIFLLRSITSWFWMLAILAFGMQRLSTRSPFLEYANEAVLPFYILHQSVLISIGYFVVQWNIADPFKWAIIAGSSFATIMVLYEFLIRRVNLFRFLFGMKLLKKEEQAVVLPARA